MVSVSAWMVKQMLQASENTASTAPHRFNPRPPGVVRANSATYAVYALLSANPKRCFNHAQIVSATGRSAKSIDWGLLFLRQCDLVESFPDRRNTRYLVYRITQTPQPTPAWAIKQEDTKRHKR